jgi:hypothetical protein
MASGHDFGYKMLDSETALSAPGSPRLSHPVSIAVWRTFGPVLGFPKKGWGKSEIKAASSLRRMLLF